MFPLLEVLTRFPWFGLAPISTMSDDLVCVSFLYNSRVKSRAWFVRKMMSPSQIVVLAMSATFCLQKTHFFSSSRFRHYPLLLCSFLYNSRVKSRAWFVRNMLAPSQIFVFAMSPTFSLQNTHFFSSSRFRHYPLLLWRRTSRPSLASHI